VTSNHSIYSSDRLDFVPAGELRVGETLRNLDGDVRIESIEQLGSEERVYNLEIHGEHVFRVASSGVLVHNSSGAQANAPKAGLPIQFGKDANQVYHAFRHLEGVVDKTKAITAITDDLNAAASSLKAGLNIREVIVDGVELTCNAFKLPDGIINVGRITVPKL